MNAVEAIHHVLVYRINGTAADGVVRMIFDEQLPEVVEIVVGVILYSCGAQKCAEGFKLSFKLHLRTCVSLL